MKVEHRGGARTELEQEKEPGGEAENVFVLLFLSSSSYIIKLFNIRNLI